MIYEAQTSLDYIFLRSKPPGQQKGHDSILRSTYSEAHNRCQDDGLVAADLPWLFINEALKPSLCFFLALFKHTCLN